MKSVSEVVSSMPNSQVLGKRAMTDDAVMDPGQGKSVLVVEDDPAVARLIRLYLVQAGYEVLVAGDGSEGLRLALERSPSLVVLDLNLPGMDGIEVCNALRSRSNVSIIMVTARVEEEDRLRGLNLGADDYVTKPFSPRELVARVNAVLRRSKPGLQETPDRSGRLAAGDIVMDLDARTVTAGEQVVRLTPTEYSLLEYFMNSVGRTVTRDQLISGALEYDFDGFDRTVDTHVSNLRRKLNAHARVDQYIKTVYGIGYRFEPS